MSTTHTPGPWPTDDYEFLWRDSDGGLTAHLEAGPAQIYFTPHDTADRQRALNDARLIAAAPELLDALIEMLDASNKPANERWLSNVRSHAIAAIVKATT